MCRLYMEFVHYPEFGGFRYSGVCVRVSVCAYEFTSVHHSA